MELRIKNYISICHDRQGLIENEVLLKEPPYPLKEPLGIIGEIWYYLRTLPINHSIGVSELTSGEIEMSANSRAEIEGFFEKYLDTRFKHIDDSTARIEAIVTDLKRDVDAKIDGIITDNEKLKSEIKTDSEKLKSEIKADNEKLKSEIKADNEKTKSEIKADNKVTRWWIVGTAITVLVGFAAIAVSIFFGFSQLQTSWIQAVISFVGKTAVR